MFTPTEIKGGLVYYPGATVDTRAYFPLAFEIAARGHLVVIVQMPLRIASYGYQDANAVIDSKHPLLSGNSFQITLLVDDFCITFLKGAHNALGPRKKHGIQDVLIFFF